MSFDNGNFPLIQPSSACHSSSSSSKVNMGAFIYSSATGNQGSVPMITSATTTTSSSILSSSGIDQPTASTLDVTTSFDSSSFLSNLSSSQTHLHAGDILRTPYSKHDASFTTTTGGTAIHDPYVHLLPWSHKVPPTTSLHGPMLQQLQKEDESLTYQYPSFDYLNYPPPTTSDAFKQKSSEPMNSSSFPHHPRYHEVNIRPSPSSCQTSFSQLNINVGFHQNASPNSYQHHISTDEGHSSLYKAPAMTPQTTLANSQQVLRSRQQAPLNKLSHYLIQTYKNINEIYYARKRRRNRDQLTDGNARKRDRRLDQNIPQRVNASPQDIEKSVTPLIQPLQKKSSDSSELTPPTKLQATVVPKVQPLATNSSKNTSSTAVNADTQPSHRTFTDENFDYIVRPGEVWMGRYQVNGLIGKGSFGQVLHVHDKATSQDMAIKVIKKRKAFMEQAQIEIRLLKTMNALEQQERENHGSDKYGTNGNTSSHFIVSLLTHFEFRGHLCLAFELLSYNLYDLLRNTNFHGVSLNLTRKFAGQLCSALAFLAQPSLNIIHCDLKPENILLVTPRRSAIKIVDFGSSCLASEAIHKYIQSRFYRAPEVLLGLKYTTAIDMWSLGCILIEMHTGEPLFAGRNTADQMVRIVEMCGMPLDDLMRRGTYVNQMFDRVDVSLRTLQQTNTSASAYRFKREVLRDKQGKYRVVQPGRRQLSDVVGKVKARRLTEPGHTESDYERFTSLVESMIVYDVDKRAKPNEALRHPFFLLRGNQSIESNSTHPTDQLTHNTSCVVSNASPGVVGPRDS